MRAMVVTAFGARLTPEEAPVPAPGPGEVRLAVRAVGLNFADTLMVEGKYQERRDPPFTPGMEICGVVDALGPGVVAPAVGERVACFAGGGGLAEFAVVPAARCVPVPDAMPDDHAAAFLVAYGTSDVALSDRAALRPGETLLVTGASGGVGLTAVEIGHLIGARVIAAARGPEKLAAAQAAGADHLIDSDGDIRGDVKALGGADVIYDTVGGAAFDAALRAARPEARILPIGFASGTVPQIPANILLVKNLTVIGLYWGAYATLRPSVLTDSFLRLFAWYEAGRLKPHVSHVLALADAEAGLELLRSRASTGKVVVRVAG